VHGKASEHDYWRWKVLTDIRKQLVIVLSYVNASYTMHEVCVQCTLHSPYNEKQKEI
jgi:predicted phosphohydrolase